MLVHPFTFICAAAYTDYMRVAFPLISPTDCDYLRSYASFFFFLNRILNFPFIQNCLVVVLLSVAIDLVCIDVKKGLFFESSFLFIITVVFPLQFVFPTALGHLWTLVML